MYNALRKSGTAASKAPLRTLHARRELCLARHRTPDIAAAAATVLARRVGRGYRHSGSGESLGREWNHEGTATVAFPLTTMVAVTPPLPSNAFVGGRMASWTAAESQRFVAAFSGKASSSPYITRINMII